MDHIDTIREEFTRQAGHFNTYQQHSAKEQESFRTLTALYLNGKERVLEVAAGTCSFGRMIAPLVAEVVELDATKAMLEAGVKENERLGIRNISYEIGLAEALPFGDETFDIVLCRLAFHHFTNGLPVMHEMSRVLKPGGKMAIIDVVPYDEASHAPLEKYEKMRDASHVRFLPEDEFNSLLEQCSLSPCWSHKADIELTLQSWLKHTQPDSEVYESVVTAVNADLSGGASTGMFPFEKDGQTYIKHCWLELIAQK